MGSSNVIPAQAGIYTSLMLLDFHLRGSDENGINHEINQSLLKVYLPEQ
jgi:hypothetical protein